MEGVNSKRMITPTTNPQIISFFKRSASTLVLAPVVLLITYLNGWMFYTLVLMSAVIMAFEWMSIIRHAEVKSKKWQVLGVGIHSNTMLKYIIFERA